MLKKRIMFINRDHDAFLSNQCCSCNKSCKWGRKYNLIDANSQQVLYQKNATKKLYPASTTKIMTMILLFEAIQRKAFEMG